MTTADYVANINAVVGVVLTIWGLVITAPGALKNFGHVWPGRSLSQLTDTVRQRLASMEFFPIEPVTGRHGGVEAPPAKGSADAIPPAEVTEKVGVAALEQRIKDLETAATDANKHSQQRDDRDRHNQEVLDNLRRDLTEQEAQAAVIDARGLLVACPGAFIGGLASQLATWFPASVSVILWVVGFAIAVFVSVRR